MKNNLSENLKKIRKDNNLSQEDLADKLGVSRQSISKWEIGDSYPEMDKIMQISEMFNVSVDNLIHSDVREVKKEEKSKNNLNKYIDDFLKYITDTVNLFSNLTFKDKIKCLFEQALLIIGLFVIFVIIGSFCSNIYSSLFYNGTKLYYKFYKIFESIYMFACLIVGLTILTHVFKIRYLNYYREIINDNKEESNEESKENKRINFKENKIVIRDPKTSEYSFIKGLVKIIVFFIKIFLGFVTIGLCFSLLTIIAGTIYSFVIIKSGLLFLGFFLGGLGAALINIVLLVVIINFIFNRYTDKKICIRGFIIGLIAIGLGIGLGLVGITNMKQVEVEPVLKKEIVMEMNSNTRMHINTYYEFVEENRRDIRIEYYGYEFSNVIFYHDSENNMINIYHKDQEFDTYKYLLKGINKKQIYMLNNTEGRVVIYTSKENIKKLSSNVN